MRKILLPLFLAIGAMCSIGANAQTAKIYQDGVVLNGIFNADSVIFSKQAVKAYKGGVEIYNITDVDSVSFAEPTATVCTGGFSVSEDLQVSFSPGNLQYTHNYFTQSWAFAEHQYDMIGEDNIDNGAMNNVIDLFGWSGTNYTAEFGVSTSTNDYEYYGSFVDWGRNIIGSDTANTWRTPTIQEWRYLLRYRTDASLLQGVARIRINDDGTQYANGLILLPDGWTCPDGITFKSGVSNRPMSLEAFADFQTFTLDEWHTLEASGAVFLPAGGMRKGREMEAVGYGGYYHSATKYSQDASYMVYFCSSTIYDDTHLLRVGQSVRLVKDMQPTNSTKANGH